MSRKAVYSGSPFEAAGGYSRALIDGRWIFVSATSGFDPAIGGFAGNTVDQARRALQVIESVLTGAGAGFADVVMVRSYLADAADVPGVSGLLAGLFSDPRPANTTIICGFPVADIRVEFEMIARTAPGMGVLAPDAPKADGHPG